ncbi:patatin-like phospholipase family protein [Legionella micdadei]|uniref:patatin-like phospholipase family protein n=1 Tax=Legionella micdadei TaxID=451 RepID=UPI0009EF76E1|nr:patatin-like phospholipase family protein [Legionella micdadei]ARG99391.1 alpha/beta hydrolase [Legionella micdadei]
MRSKPKTINLALQGGGTHGALAWGILDKLLEDGRVQFEGISATSAGATNAAVLAHGLVTGGNEGARESLYKFWKTISDVGQIYNPIRITPLEELWGIKPEYSMSYLLFNLLTEIFSPAQLNPLNINPLINILNDQVNFDKIKSSNKVKIFISATNIRTGKIKIFDNQELSVDAIMASACLPFLFQPIRINDDYYWDGGFMGNPALYPLIYNSQCTDILILHINPIYREKVPETATEILNRMNEISFNSSLMREMRAVAFVSKLLDEGWFKDAYKRRMKRMLIHAIRTDVIMEKYSVASKLSPSWSFISHLFEEGRKEGEKWLKQNLRYIGKKSSIDITEYL